MKRFFTAILFCFSFVLISQTAVDQEVFKNKIWKVVTVSDKEQSFFDKHNKLLGRKIKQGNVYVYQDKWKRNLRTVKAPVPVKVVTGVKKTNPPKKINKPAVNNKNLKRANQSIVRNNKATFYNAFGEPYRTAKRRRNKVYFHDQSGSLMGYKIYHKNGSKVYKDAKGRVTGRSHIDKKGKMIYRAKNRRRQTPRILFEDPFLFSR